MKYNQPYGISDPNAAYINGNPTTGTMGSIPPAASIEYDQREIVAVIKYAADHGFVDFANALCLQPDNADLQQLLKAIFGIFNSNRLTAPKTYYVNTTTGDDTFNGTSPSTPFKTLQRAANQSSYFNLNGYSVTVNVADGVYGQVTLPPVNGSGNIFFTGNVAVPANCRIHSNIGPAVIVAGGPYWFEGFRYESDAPNPPLGHPGSGVWSIPGGALCLGRPGAAGTTNEFGNCNESHIHAVKGTVTFIGNIRVCGNAFAHLAVGNAAFAYSSGPPACNLIIPSAQTFSYFAHVNDSANLVVNYASISGAANVTGIKFAALSNGVLNAAGNGINYLPGTVAGFTGSGGQYV